MLRREIPTPLFIAVIILVLLIAVALFWRKIGGRAEIVLEKAEKPYPTPPIFKQPPPR